MQVKKRNGVLVDMKFDNISTRIKNMCVGIESDIDVQSLAMKVIESLYDGVATTDIDTLIAEISASNIANNPDYSQLASNVSVSNLHKNIKKKFSSIIKDLYEYVNPKNGKHSPIVSDELYNCVLQNSAEINAYIDYTRDYNYDYFGLRTLEKSYLLKINGVIAERPQDMLMRVSLGIHGSDLLNAFKTYDMMSKKQFTHATPTLFNSGTPRPQMSSCFLLTIQDDSIDGIYDTLKQTAKISKDAGGIGLSIHNIRATGSYISGTNGISNGIVPMLKVFNETARYVDQCFTGETLINTKSGLKPIKDISRGDLVLTDDGNWNTVNEKRMYEKHSSEVLDIKCISTVSVTDIHPLLGIKVGDNSTPKRELNRLNNKINFVDYFEAKEFTKGDYLGRKIPTNIIDVNLTEDDFRFYGILLGDGSISSNVKKLECNIYLDTIEKSKTIDFVESYLNKLMIKYNKTVNDSITIIYIYLPTNPSFKFGRNDLYNIGGEKVINEKYLNIGQCKALSMLRGLIETDGSIKDDRIRFYNSSKPLVDCIDYMLLRLNTPFYIIERDRIDETKDNDIKHTKLNYDCEIPKTELFANFFNVTQSKFFKHLVYDGALFVKIKSIKYKNNDENVITYDLCVDNNHTYSTQISSNTNGGGKRKGSFAIYIEPWHADIMDFLDLKKNHGKEEMRARDLFYAMWVNDLFMERVEIDGDWSLMCPNECKGLDEVYGDEFKVLYEKYESENKFVKQIKARELWEKIIVSQIETGTPYMLYKDSANIKNNQKNLGTIKSSNLCSEIMEYTSPDEVAVCNLASISLPSFVKIGEDGKVYFDYDELYNVSRQATFNLNRVIDKNYYPVIEAENSNFKHRPIGLGSQGLADVFALMRIPFESDEAKEINRKIYEVIYFASLTESNEIAKTDGVYPSYEGSPISKGILQFDMWGLNEEDLSGLCDWSTLRQDIAKYGVRNSLVTAGMPTASTGQILGNNEAFEPYTSNIFTRRVLSGEFIVVNKHLIRDLMRLGLWNDDMKQMLMSENGSVQNLPVPTDIKELYKTVWEMSMKNIIDMSVDRGSFTDQSQSLNLFMEGATVKKLTSMHFYAWKKGLKTGMYYLRTKGATDAKKFTITKDFSTPKEPLNETLIEKPMSIEAFKEMVARGRDASENDDDGCVMCSG